MSSSVSVIPHRRAGHFRSCQSRVDQHHDLVWGLKRTKHRVAREVSQARFAMLPVALDPFRSGRVTDAFLSDDVGYRPDSSATTILMKALHPTPSPGN